MTPTPKVRLSNCPLPYQSQILPVPNYKKTCSGPTPPPTSENEIDLTELYRRHPQLWQGFVTIKKHAAMVQLHYLSGDKILGMLF